MTPYFTTCKSCRFGRKDGRIVVRKTGRIYDMTDGAVGLLLRWYYGFHLALDGTADEHLKRMFLPVYKESDDVLGAMRDAGTLSDETCNRMYEMAVQQLAASNGIGHGEKHD
jgi:hypothetical protein